MAKQDNQDEASSFASDDDDYEYTYVDSDTEEQQQQQLCGIKRNASPSFALNDGNIHTRGAPSSHKEEDTCRHCHKETHFPITQCELVTKWTTQTQDRSLGIIVMHAQHLIPTMKRRIHECATQLGISDNDAFLKLRQENWQLETLFDGSSTTTTMEEEEATTLRDTSREARMAKAMMQDDDDDDDDFAILEAIAAFEEQGRFLSDDKKKAAKPPPKDVSTMTPQEQQDALDASHREASFAGTAAAYSQELNGRKTPPKEEVELASAATAASSEKAPAKEETSTLAPVQKNGGNYLLPIDNNDEEEDRKLPAVEEAPDERVCQICMEDHDNLSEDDMMSMSCGHMFCKDCWKGFIEHMFDNAVLPDECLHTTCPIPSCETVVTEVQIEQVAPALLPEYENRQLHSFVEGNRATLRWCPGPDCANRLAVRCKDRLFGDRNNNALVASCGGCQTKFCFRCGQEPHEDRYCELDQPESSDGKPVKNCPRCTIKIEKNGGCNRMRCKCGHAFCWICLEDMNDYNHFCGREGAGGAADNARAQRREARRIVVPAVNIDYVLETLKEGLASDDEEVSRIFQQKKEMEHIAHYFNRYTAHDQGQHFAENQCALLLEGRAIDFAKASGLKSATDTDFLAAANKRLVASRRMLKYTYCYAFYLPDEESEGMISQKGLFQNHQERLERFTEKLSEISEHALTYDDRARIVNLIGIIDQCMEAIIGFEEFGAKYATPK